MTNMRTWLFLIMLVWSPTFAYAEGDIIGPNHELTFTDPNTQLITEYRLFVSQTPGGQDLQGAPFKIVSFPVQKILMEGLVPDGQWYGIVVPVQNVTVGPASAEIPFEFDSTPPSTPTVPNTHPTLPLAPLSPLGQPLDERSLFDVVKG